MPVMNKNKTKNQTNKPGYRLKSAALTNPSDYVKVDQVIGQ